MDVCGWMEVWVSARTCGGLGRVAGHCLGPGCFSEHHRAAAPHAHQNLPFRPLSSAPPHPTPPQVFVTVGKGPGRGMAWGCDLSYDYVKINAEYTT